MKLNRFFMLGLAGLAFAACSNEDNPAVGGDGSNKTMVVSIAGIGAESTRAITDGEDAWGQDDSETAALLNINKITLLFTDQAGKILYAYSDDRPSGADGNWDGLFGTTGVKFLGLEGVEQVYAIANQELAPDLKTILNKNVSEFTTALNAQSYAAVKAKSSVRYVGWDKDITPYHAEPSPEMPELGKDDIAAPESYTGKEGNFYYEAAIKLVPMVSRIQINKISVETSGETLFPEEAAGSITAKKFKLAWTNFKPVLNGIYLNNFYNTFNSFSGLLADKKQNSSFFNGTGADTDYFIKEGKWLFNGTDFASDAAYVSYEDDAYTALLSYASAPATGKVDLVIPDTDPDDQVSTCVAFNLFVPVVLNASDEIQAADVSYNPTIHFQFDKEVTGYNMTTTLADGSPVTDPTDKDWLATCSTTIDYTLPETEEYLFANINKLFSDSDLKTELNMKPGMIYNMDVTISPVNMNIDIQTVKEYNVVVKITVVPFSVQTIYPGLD